jgi:putative thioredoxin
MAAAMSGAVDLAALKARSDAVARAADAPPPTAASAVVTVDEASFQSEVLDRSFQVPVLLDLRAPWSEPSGELSPVLEKLAAEGGGRWVLAAVDVDANPRIVQALQAKSVPSVFAVIGGQVVPGFEGVLPEAQLREFIAAVMQASEEAGLTGVVPGDPGGEVDEPQLPGDPRFDAAETALEAGDFDGAAAAYQAILDAEPANAEAALALRQTRFMKRMNDAPDGVVERANAAPTDLALALAAADFEMAANQIQASIDRLIALVAKVFGDDRDAVRDRLIDYFELLGPDEPLVPPARRRLANALF